MTPRKPKPSQSDTVTVGDKAWETLWTEAIGDRPQESRPDGPGWKTVIEVAKERGITRGVAEYHCRKLALKGLLETTIARTGPKRIPTKFYRPKPQKPARKGKTTFAKY